MYKPHILFKSHRFPTEAIVKKGDLINQGYTDGIVTVS